MNDNLQQFLKDKAAIAPEGYNWIASLHPNTWYYCVNNTQVYFEAVKHYRLAGLCEGETGQWFKLEGLNGSLKT
jgi:hypothetical protein